MGKGKAVLLHLLAVAAGWGIVAALRPVVGSWQRGGGEAAAESRAPSKTGRVRSTAGIAAGQQLLQRFTDARQRADSGGADSDPGPELSLRDLVDEYRKDSGFDPATPAPNRNDNDEAEQELDDPFADYQQDAFSKYHMILERILRDYLEGERGPDLAHAFRVGRLDAGAIYDSLAAHLPGAAADHTLRRVLFDKLAPLDPVRAATLLAPLSEEEAAQKKGSLVVARSSGFTPDTAYALLSSIAASGESARSEREYTWSRVTSDFLGRYGSDDYLHWLEQLPAGPNREEAAAALLSYLEKGDVFGYRRIRALVTDPVKLAPYPPR